MITGIAMITSMIIIMLMIMVMTCISVKALPAPTHPACRKAG
jgi:hypothetical protein